MWFEYKQNVLLLQQFLKVKKEIHKTHEKRAFHSGGALVLLTKKFNPQSLFKHIFFIKHVFVVILLFKLTLYLT